MQELEKYNKNQVVASSYNSVTEQYQAALKVVDDIVLKNYVGNLNRLEVIPLDPEMLSNNLKDNVMFFKISEMVYEKEEFALYKFASVFNALSMTKSTIFIIIDSDGIKTDFYMGVRSLDSNRTISSLRNTLENAMKGQFPGIKTQNYTIEEMENVMSKIRANSISSVSCVANSKVHENANNKNFVQGLEKLVLSMQGEKYTGIIIANGTTQGQLRELRREYEDVYTQLSAFGNTQVNYTSSSSVNYSVSESKGESHGTSHTDNKSVTEGQAQIHSTSSTNGTTTEEMRLKKVIVTLSRLGEITNKVKEEKGIKKKAATILNEAESAFRKSSRSNSTSTSDSTAKNFSETTGSSDGTTDSVNLGTSKTEGNSNGLSEGKTLTLHNKSVETMLERIDKQLERMGEFESLGMYECAAYFVSEDQYAAEVAASTYKALMRGENSGVEIAAINSWGKTTPDKTRMIGQYVTNFIHPVFKYSGEIGEIEVTASSYVSGNELAVHMGLPRHSVCGLPVIEHADFGKEIVTYEGKKQVGGINIGNIFNMGNSTNNSVKLDINSLSMHTFVTGSTGSGKSNTVYELLRQLRNNNVKFMVVEPAKGEYKNIFGNKPDVVVLGTNSQYTDLLHINPFKFPKNIHLLEHIDRLVEIFNVCWPMYAAMPAVLKEAVLQSYQGCGWDLSNSTNSYSEDLFPTFRDLLNKMEDVINKSAFSNEVKSNYIGSLVTRIKSLTNGLNGQIFSAKEIDNDVLFDKNVIIDLSRVGSFETKSLIMGILVMRLSEHRMSNATGINMPLKHVTVLEEAHNILKRTSTEQNPENSSISGKSVEMISNAIAEMRTYGEGFIIADQSPSAVDVSAIRNTNTKIIMRLPDEQDRRLAGKAAGLKDEQLDEIAKLPKGVAVIYQNDWLEPVLCKIRYFEADENQYVYNNKPQESKQDKIKQTILRCLLSHSANKKVDYFVDDLKEQIIESDLSGCTKYVILEALKLKDQEKSIENVCEAVSSLFNSRELLSTVSMEIFDIEKWNNKLLEKMSFDFGNLGQVYKNLTLQCILKQKSVEKKDYVPFYDKWSNQMNGGDI